MLERLRIVKQKYPYPLKHEIYLQKRKYRAPPRKQLATSMTIAAAFVCSDGIVLAADSEYTYNYSKYEGEKLFQIFCDQWGIGIAGAGTMPLVKMFVDDLTRELQGVVDMRSIHEKIIERAQYFDREYIRKADEQRQLLLLIAIQMKSASHNLLLKVNGDLVEPVSRCDFIGVGDEIARATASWLFHPSLPRRVVGQLALHIMYWTTQHAQYCGKTTYSMGVPNPWKLEQSITNYEITEFFWGVNDFLRPIIIGCMNTEVSEQDFEQSIKRFEEKMHAVRRDSMRAAAPSPFASPSSPTAPERQP